MCPHLLLLEGVQVEELLQLLVGVVDAELLERVCREDLEAEDVQKADPAVRPLRRRVELRVHPRDDQQEERRVDELDEGVALVDRRRLVERNVVLGARPRRPQHALDQHAEPGDEDRRQRRLYPTQKGRALAVELSEAQVRRIGVREHVETSRLEYM